MARKKREKKTAPVLEVDGTVAILMKALSSSDDGEFRHFPAIARRTYVGNDNYMYPTGALVGRFNEFSVAITATPRLVADDLMFDQLVAHGPAIGVVLSLDMTVSAENGTALLQNHRFLEIQAPALASLFEAAEGEELPEEFASVGKKIRNLAKRIHNYRALASQREEMLRQSSIPQASETEVLDFSKRLESSAAVVREAQELVHSRFNRLSDEIETFNAELSPLNFDSVVAVGDFLPEDCRQSIVMAASDTLRGLFDVSSENTSGGVTGTRFLDDNEDEEYDEQGLEREEDEEEADASDIDSSRAA